MRVGESFRRFLRGPRVIRATRQGWGFLLVTLGLGLAAANTGNNILYLLVSTLLALIVASGILSEQSLRGLRLDRIAPREIFARQPALVGHVLTNRKRWFSTYSIALEAPGVAEGESRVLYIPKLEPGREVILSVEARFPRRGRHQLPGARVVTRFPFGLFRKINHPLPGQEVLVYPEVNAVTFDALWELGSVGNEPQRRVGQGTELHNLRDYRWGDDPRLIHWKSSAKVGTLMIREVEAETAVAVRLELEPAQGPLDSECLEAALSRAASLAVHLIGKGAQVGLTGPDLYVPLGQSPAHLRRILEALALFDPAGVDPSSRPPAPQGRLPGEPTVRVIRIPLTGLAVR